MPESEFVLLSPGGQSSLARLADDVPIARLSDAVTLALGLPRGTGLTLRRQDGTLIDQQKSLGAAEVRPGDVVLVEAMRTAQPRGLLRRGKRQWESSPLEENVIPNAYRVLPCYLAVDTSGSMQGSPIQAVNAELPRLRLKMLREPELAETCQVAVVTFNAAARIHMGLTDISLAAFSELQADGRTDYCEVFGLLRATIASDLYDLYRHGRRPYRPVVFFLTDGMHNGAQDWHGLLETLTDRHAFHGAPNMIAFGFGDAQEQVIREIGQTAAYMPAEGSPSASLDTFMTFLLSSLTASMTQSDRDEDDILVVPRNLPGGWRALRVPQ